MDEKTKGLLEVGERRLKSKEEALAFVETRRNKEGKSCRRARRRVEGGEEWRVDMQYEDLSKQNLVLQFILLSRRGD